MERVANGFVDLCANFDKVNFENNDRSIKMFNAVNDNAKEIVIMKGLCFTYFCISQ